MKQQKSEHFDDLTMQFEKETGIWPPGRDRAAAMGPEDICDVRLRAFGLWRKYRDCRARCERLEGALRQVRDEGVCGCFDEYGKRLAGPPCYVCDAREALKEDKDDGK